MVDDAANHNDTSMPGTSGESSEPKVDNGVLYLIGLGLGDEKDITLRGLEAVRSVGRVYLEAYTSILGVNKERLEALYERKITIADREFVEERAEQMLDEAATLPGGAAMLVVGDAFGATTHTDLWLRARERGIRVETIHNASIMNAVGCVGLQLYNYGQAISLCFWTATDRPKSYFEKLLSNRRQGLHTLCLLDIKVKEPSLESLARGRKVYEPPRYMSVNQAVDQLLTIAEEEGSSDIGPDTIAVGLARLGQPDQKIVAGPMKLLKDFDFGDPLHSLVVPARKLHFHEREVLKVYCVPGGEESLVEESSST